MSLLCFFPCFSSLLPYSLVVAFCIFFCLTLAVCKNCESCLFEISKYERFRGIFLCRRTLYCALAMNLSIGFLVAEQNFGKRSVS